MATPVDSVQAVYYNGTQPFPIMHTEDDTFAALKRIPFHEMRLKIRAAKVDNRRYSFLLLLTLLKDNGWTRTDYQLALADHIKHQTTL